jgi:ketosteroid isomerase-like protein
MSLSESKQQLIQTYIDAYNNFDVDGMMNTFAQDVVFKNITDGEVSMELNGKEAFRQQALQALKLFSSRKKSITAINNTGNFTEVEIMYHAVLAADLPNGLKAGQQINLTGKSIFVFGDNKIVSLTDIS